MAKNTNKKPLTPGQEAAKAEKAAKAKAASEAKAAAKAAEEAAKAAENQVTCSVDECENAATMSAPVEGGTVDSCDEHRDALSEQLGIAADDWKLIEAEAPPAPPNNEVKPARETKAAKSDAPYDAKRRAQLVQAIRAGGVVKLRGGKIITKVEDLP